MEDFEDDWFFDSIRCYRTLQMYDLQIKPERVVQVNDTNLCIAGVHEVLRKTEVMCIKLPKKLLVSPEAEGRCKGNDFDILSGGFFDAPVHNLAALPQTGQVLASFRGEVGLSVLNMGVKSSNVIKEEQKLLEASDMKTVNFAINNNFTYGLVSKTATDRLIAFDVSSGQVIHTTPVPEPLSGANGAVLATFSSCPIIINSSTGCALSLDERTFNPCAVISEPGLSSHYVIAADSDNYVCVLQACGECRLFDMRSLNSPVLSSNLNLSTELQSELKVGMSSRNRLSVSGVGSSVYIYEVHSSEIRHVFTHKGHDHSDICSGGIVTDHLWLPQVSDNFFVSCCSNGTLNCWDYKV